MAKIQIEKLKSDIQTTEKSLVTQRELLETLKSEYSLMIRDAYFNRNVYKKLAFVFSSQNYNQAFKRLKYLQEYSLFRQNQVEEILVVEQQLNDELLMLKQQKVLLLVAKNQKSKSLEESKIEIGFLADEKSSQNTLLSSLKKKEKQLKKRSSIKKILGKSA